MSYTAGPDCSPVLRAVDARCLLWGDGRSWRHGHSRSLEIQTKCPLQRHFLFQDHRSPGSYEKLEKVCLVCVLDLDRFKASENLSPIEESGPDHSYLVMMRLCSEVPQMRNREARTWSNRKEFFVILAPAEVGYPSSPPIATKGMQGQGSRRVVRNAKGPQTSGHQEIAGGICSRVKE